MTDPLAGFAQFVEESRRAADVPGLAIGIVRDGVMISAQGFGVREIARDSPVTPETIFPICSATKAFTTTALAMLVDEGKLNWDRPVRDYLPSFRLFDPVATERTTPRDLATHRTGLPRHDTLWHNSPFTRRELFNRLRYLEPSRDFRAEFQYSNLMYMAAGCLLEEITRSSYETVIQRRILNRLGMNHSNLSVETSAANPNHATPHLDDAAGIHSIPWTFTSAGAPAGGINSNVLDMCKWLCFNLNRGRLNGERIVSEKNMVELHTPQIVEAGLLGVRQFTRYREVSHACYGLGWTMFTYRGHTLIFHGGSMDGFISATSFMPDDGIGISVFANLHETLLPWLVTYNAYDRLLGLDELPWTQRIADTKNQVAPMPALERKPNAPPSHTLADYTGKYEHPGYGVLTITQEGDTLKAVYNNLPIDLFHLHYDHFDLVFKRHNRSFQSSFVTDLNGAISAITVPLEPAVKPILFSRKGTRS